VRTRAAAGQVEQGGPIAAFAMVTDFDSGLRGDAQICCCLNHHFCKKTCKSTLCAPALGLKCCNSLKNRKKFLKMSRRCQN